MANVMATTLFLLLLIHGWWKPIANAWIWFPYVQENHRHKTNSLSMSPLSISFSKQTSTALFASLNDSSSLNKSSSSSSALVEKTSISQYLVPNITTATSRKSFLATFGALTTLMEFGPVPSGWCWDSNDESNPTLQIESILEPLECREGTIVSESAVPGAYQQQCMALPQRSIRLQSTGHVLTVSQGGELGAGRTGVAVWNSGLLLTRLLDAMTGTSKGGKSSDGNAWWWQNKTVLELGCGTGLAGMAVAQMGGATTRVLLTDGNPDVIQLAQHNVQQNQLQNQVTTSVLSWGFLDASDYVEVADVIVGSDLTYNSGTWRVLAETLATVLKPGGIVLYLTLGHAGFNVQGEMNGFLSVVQNEGLKVVPEGDAHWPLPVASLSETLRQCLTPPEQATLDATGGVRVAVLRKPPVLKYHPSLS